MKTYDHIEDYLEVIAGKRELDGSIPKNQLAWAGLGFDFKPIVSLARYDVNFLDSVTDATIGGTSLTDRQAELALKIIGKYTRQLHAQGIDVDGIIKVPVYRKPIRIVDRSKTIWVDDGEIFVKFTFEQKIIEYIRDNAKTSQGHIKFDKESRVWRMALTEYNVNWISEFASTYNFTVDPALKNLMQMILDCENQQYEIQLAADNQKLTIRNAPAPLLEYLEQPDNQFDISRLAELVDKSGSLGYTVHPDILKTNIEKFGSSITIMLQNREYSFKNENWSDLESKVYQYAQLTNRFPVVVFDPQGNFAVWKSLVDAGDVLDLTRGREINIQNSTAKIILTNRAIKSMDNIPLLVSCLGMFVGQDKRIMLDASEKVFYINDKLA
jgi:hypothetical protein